MRLRGVLAGGVEGRAEGCDGGGWRGGGERVERVGRGRMGRGGTRTILLLGRERETQCMVSPSIVSGKKVKPGA